MGRAAALSGTSSFRQINKPFNFLWDSKGLILYSTLITRGVVLITTLYEARSTKTSANKHPLCNRNTELETEIINTATVL